MMSLEEFKRMDLRIGRIVGAEPIAGAEKLLKLTVDLGAEPRTLVGGVGQSYRPGELIGLQVVVVANLAPARIRGVESQGMLLGVGCEDATRATLLGPHRPTPNGARVT